MGPISSSGAACARPPLRGRRKRGRALVGLLVAGAVPLTTGTTASVAVGATAPDGRGYEMVSPLDKGGLGVSRPDGGSFAGGNSPNATIVLPDGSGIAYVAGGAFAGTEASTGAGLPYLGRRTDSGWTTVGLAPPYSPPTSLQAAVVMSQHLTDDASSSVVQTPGMLTPNAPACVTVICSQLLYVRDNQRGTYQLVSPVPAGMIRNGMFGAATPNHDRVIFGMQASLVPGAPSAGQTNLYEWIADGTAEGRLRMVGFDVDGTPLPAGSVPGAGLSGTSDKTYELRRALSDDGRRIFFTSDGRLYLREDGERTVWVSRSQKAGSPGGTLPATYVTAENAHGSAVFFTSEEQLTDDSQATDGAPDLYRFDVETGDLTDVTASAGAAGVLGLVETTPDAGTLYFTATRTLVAGKGVAGVPNLYRWHDDGTAKGRLTFVATLDDADAGDNWSRSVRPDRVSPDGRFLAFLSSAPITDDATNGITQAYRYDAQGSGRLECVSCTAAAGGSTAAASFRLGFRTERSRIVSDDGRVAFQTDEALSPRDVNGTLDVYLYADGAPQLISAGEGPEGSVFLGMDPAAKNVFFATRDALVPADRDELSDVYSAREGGGFAPIDPPVPCLGDGCKGGTTPPPAVPDPGSTVTGPSGNVVPAPAPEPASFRLAAISAKQARGWSRTGRLTVSVRTSQAGVVKTRVRGRIGNRMRTIATASRTAEGAGTTRLTLRLSAPARAALERGHRLRVTVTTSYSRVRKTQRRNVTLRRTDVKASSATKTGRR